MKTTELADHIIGIAEILGVKEDEVMEALFDAFENRSDIIPLFELCIHRLQLLNIQDIS